MFIFKLIFLLICNINSSSFFCHNVNIYKLKSLSVLCLHHTWSYHLILNISLYLWRSLFLAEDLFCGCLKLLTSFHNLRRHKFKFSISDLCKSYASEDWSICKGTPSISIHLWECQKIECLYCSSASFFYSFFNTFWLFLEPIKLQWIVFSYRKPCWCSWCSYQVCWVLPRSKCHGDWKLGSNS